MNFLNAYYKELISIGVPVFVWFLNTRFQPKARLIQGVRHSSSMLIDQPWLDENGNERSPRTHVRQASVQFLNAGRHPATNTQITLNYRPQHLNVWPNRHIEEHLAPDGRLTLTIGTLPPKEAVYLELMGVNIDLPGINSAFCDQCSAKVIPLSPQIVQPPWKIWLILWCAACGLALNVYALIFAVQFLAARA